MQVCLAAKHSVIASDELANQICTLKCFDCCVFITTITHQYILHIPMSTSSRRSGHDIISRSSFVPFAAPKRTLGRN